MRFFGLLLFFRKKRLFHFQLQRRNQYLTCPLFYKVFLTLSTLSDASKTGLYPNPNAHKVYIIAYIQTNKHHVNTSPHSHRHLPLPNPRRHPPRLRLRLPTNRSSFQGQCRNCQRGRYHFDHCHLVVLVVCLDASVAPFD